VPTFCGSRLTQWVQPYGLGKHSAVQNSHCGVRSGQTPLPAPRLQALVLAAAQKLASQAEELHSASEHAKLVQALSLPEPMPREFKLAVTTDASACKWGVHAELRPHPTVRLHP